MRLKELTSAADHGAFSAQLDEQWSKPQRALGFGDSVSGETPPIGFPPELIAASPKRCRRYRQHHRCQLRVLDPSTTSCLCAPRSVLSHVRGGVPPGSTSPYSVEPIRPGPRGFDLGSSLRGEGPPAIAESGLRRFTPPSRLPARSAPPRSGGLPEATEEDPLCWEKDSSLDSLREAVQSGSWDRVYSILEVAQSNRLGASVAQIENGSTCIRRQMRPKWRPRACGRKSPTRRAGRPSACP